MNDKTANPVSQTAGYDCWLGYRKLEDENLRDEYRKFCSRIVITEDTALINSALQEISRGISGMLGIDPVVSQTIPNSGCLILGTIGNCPGLAAYIQAEEERAIGAAGFIIKMVTNAKHNCLIIAAKEGPGLLYAVFCWLRLLQTQTPISALSRIEKPRNPLRLINHWDHLDGSVIRGYAGASIFFAANRVTANLARLKDYARLLASIGINGVVLNHYDLTNPDRQLVNAGYLAELVKPAEVFRAYGIKMFLGINFALPMLQGDLASADPLEPEVRAWWRRKAAEIYGYIPDFGGFIVKADSEFTPGPFTYGRNHAEGANMLAEALQPYGGLVIWRAFVYNCTQDWRDRSIDRARAAYDHFKPLDGKFLDNVVLQIKNGPMDFQVREPVSPLFGALEHTNQAMELQITQEYTGQQRHLCYLVPLWKEALDFETYAKGAGSPVKKIADGSLFHRPYAGLAGISNIGDDPNWTGHDLAQANLYGFGRLAWDPDLTAAGIGEEWIRMTFGNESRLIEGINKMLLASRQIYENYTAPLGIGWMVNPGHHYGPSVDGYEYSKWGTYHRADRFGIGIDRTVKSGTGFAGQYRPENAQKYESVATCPEELLLFFHHLPYTHRLRSGKTIIQYIYDTHFAGVEQVAELRSTWLSLRDLITDERFTKVLARLEEQLEHAKEWRDVINSYFFRKTGLNDELHRPIF